MASPTPSTYISPAPYVTTPVIPSAYAGATPNPMANDTQQKTNLASVTYACGRCAADVTLKPKEPIRCKECGHRILYKKRTTRSFVFYFKNLLMFYLHC